MTGSVAIADAGWWRRVRILFGACFRAAPRHATALFACQLAATACTLAATYGVKVVTDAALHAQAGRALAAAGLMAGATGLAAVFGRGYLQLTTTVSERAGRYIDSELMRLAGTIPTIEHYERPQYADQLALIRQERAGMAGMLNAVVLNLRVVVSFAGGIAILATLDPILALLPLFGIPALLANRYAAGLAQRARERSAPHTRLRNHLFQTAASAPAGKELRVYGLLDDILDRHRAISERVERDARRAALRGLAATTGAAVVFAGAYIAALLLVLVAAVHGHATAGTLVLTLSLAGLINAQLASAVQYASYLRRVLSAGGRLAWLTDYSRTAGPDQERLAEPPVRLRDGIDLDGVCFRYAENRVGSPEPSRGRLLPPRQPGSERRAPETDPLVLDQITVHLPAGAVVALVGENGSGKTTLVKLLSGLYRPTAGGIRADGTDLATIDPAGWQRRVSPAFQDFVRFEFTLGESVGLGDLPRAADPDAVAAALRRAGAGELAELPPHGLGTQLGTAWGGVDLSGGQWQKLALGRAFMRERPLLVVFDEPTAALDAFTEQALFRDIAEATRAVPRSERPITLLVSHRFTTAAMADLVIVLDHGRIAELGDHATLLGNGGLYAELHELQARAYR
ncbi:ATP-binding cassette domain-containing protein [Rugosimonospora africana]|uniref:ABC transporter permease n=1 Tax=Rugosimonospora africana TaxID=556532 RepID=A0A8J3QV46_9ACTN|nr:ABC transporter ATP-binding protein [Rugosimonospora africana]GIH17388.1 ABC transporter permease [Rugosimonospora africana]